MQPIVRHYNTSDVDMLITTSTVVENAVSHKAFLQSKRSNWADPYFDDVAKRIDDAIKKYLGVDSVKALRQATAVVNSIQTDAIKKLAECKVQIVEDFKKDKSRRDEILNQLGFASYHTDAQKSDQKALINLLYQFKTNLDKPLKDEMVAKGMLADTLNTITGYADALKDADVSQEAFKGKRKEITTEAITEFNDIYDTVISICNISKKFFADKPEVRDQFSFTKVAKVTKSKTKTPPTPPETKL